MLNRFAVYIKSLNEKKSSDIYGYILPNIIYGKTFFSEKLGIFDFKSDLYPVIIATCPGFN